MGAKVENKSSEPVKKSIQAAETYSDAPSKVGPFAVKFGEHATLFANPKNFSSGAVGFGIYGRVMIDGRTYQCSSNLILVG